MSASERRRADGIPLTVIGGYLGAGKTTLLNHLLRQADGLRIALVINDFGALNIDADLIERHNDRQINLTNGCICCGMSDGFDAALDELLARAPPPEQIVVEASGVAEVGILARYAWLDGLRPDGVVVVADGEQVRGQAADRFVGGTVGRQLRAADVVVANKTDLLSAGDRDALLDWLGEAAPQAVVLPAEHGRVPLAALLGSGHHAARTDREHGAHAHADYVSWTFEDQRAFTRTSADDFVAALPDTVIRAKGTLRLEDGSWLLQVVGARRSLLPVAAHAPTRVVAIGLRGQLDPAQLERAAARLRPADR